ncbi:NAD-dependent epimerase/dehydratase family protein [Candidatus Bathyarchaeota archaeon]|nr:NAD-dependent epimerase/dehydratase family protein [Candidatus Bathyarchaeota archaeon]
MILVTGGAGFIGSHLVDQLLERGERVRVLDNLSSGSLKNLEGWLNSPNLDFIEGDLLDPGDVDKALRGCEAVYHMAAIPEVRLSRASPEEHFKQNIEATYNLLEAIAKGDEVKLYVFASSSTVYGDAEVIPTPENYAPLEPISVYGASKLAAEALSMAYAHTYGFRCIIYRMANIVGPRINHGVIYDFIEKLRRNPKRLEVLGDGTQSKSYLYVTDCVEGMLTGVERSSGRVEIFNIGSEDRVGVSAIAHIVIEEMGLSDVEVYYTGGVDGGRGWKGDVKLMQLDVSKLKSLGWRPRMGSEEAVRLTARWLVRHYEGGEG